MIAAPWAVLLIRWLSELSFPGAAVVLLIVAPGYAVYVGLLLKVMDRRVWLDPGGVWIALVFINVVWLLMFGGDWLTFKRPETFWPTVSVIASIVCGGMGWRAVETRASRQARARDR